LWSRSSRFGSAVPAMKWPRTRRASRRVNRSCTGRKRSEAATSNELVGVDAAHPGRVKAEAEATDESTTGADASADEGAK